MKFILKPILLVITALAAMGAAARAEDLKVKIVTATGASKDAMGKAVEVGRELKAQDVIETTDHSSVEVMIFKGGAPGSIVRVTPNSRLTVVALSQQTKDDETNLSFEISVQKVDAIRAPTIAAD